MSFTTFNFGLNILIWSDVLFGLFVPVESAEARRWFWYFFAFGNAFVLLVYIPVLPSDPPAIGLTFGFFSSLAALLVVNFMDMAPLWKAAMPWMALLGPATVEVLIYLVWRLFRR